MIDCKLENLIDYLSSKDRFLIPNWQRDYEWSKDTALNFVDDILNATEDRPYFGDMIVYENNGEVMLGDAQQRATTAMILSYCVWDHLDAEEKRKKALRRMFVAESDTDGESELPKIVFKNEDDNDIMADILDIDFNHRQETKVDSENKYDSRGSQLHKNYVAIKNRVNEKIHNGTSIDSIRKAMQKAKVCIKFAESEEEAMKAFRKVNFEGERVSDFRAAAEYVGEGEDSNNQFLKDLQTKTSDKEGRELIGLFTYYKKTSSKYEERQFLKKLKKIDEPLKELSDFYTKWYKPIIDFSFDGGYSKEEREVFNNQYAMKYSIMRQAVIVLFSDMFKTIWESKGVSFDDKVKMYKAIMWGHINNTINGKGAQTANLFNFIDIFAKFENNEYSIDDIVKEFMSPKSLGTITAEEVCNDKVKRLRVFDMMILEECEKYLESECIERIVVDSPTLEHIYSQKAKDIYKDSDMEELKYTLGNLTIITKPVNSSMQNNPYIKKKDVYERSGLKINDSVKGKTEWSVTEISDRNKMFAETLTKMFNL